MGAARWTAKWIVPTSSRTRRGPIPRRCSARLHARRHGRVSARVRHEPRPLRDRDQRPARRRPGVRARMDELRQAAAVPDVRRHRPRAARAERRRRHARRRLVPRTSRLETRATPTAARSRCSRRSSCATPTAASRVVATNDAWKASTGPILSSDIYNGETYDARLERRAGARPGFADAGWKASARVAPDDEHRRASGSADPPHRGDQAAQGDSHAGRRDGVRHGAEHGRAGCGSASPARRERRSSSSTRRCSTRRATSTRPTCARRSRRDSYTLKGGGEEIFEPHFTFHGFRYVKVEGYPGTPALDAITGMVVHSDMPRTGDFETSDTMLNQLYHNIVWGQQGNFVGVPTDCPQRDERLGWTGDAQVFSRTAAFNFDVAGFFTNWLRDLAADQRPNGCFPTSSPTCSRAAANGTSSAGWGDAAVIVPGRCTWRTGTSASSRISTRACAPYVEYQRKRRATSCSGTPGGTTATGCLRHDTPTIPARRRTRISSRRRSSRTPPTCSRARASARQDGGRAHLSRSLRAASGPRGRRNSSAHGPRRLQHADRVRARAPFHLIPDQLRPTRGSARRHVRAIGHLTTGFLGTPYLTDALTEIGHLDEAYRLLLNKKYPSWLYPITQGATTIWERWDGQEPDSSFQDIGMNSFNHYAYGAIGDWMVQRSRASISTRRRRATSTSSSPAARWRAHVGARRADDAVREPARGGRSTAVG